MIFGNSLSTNGLVRSSTSQTGVTTTFAYDAFQREVSQTDGRGNTTRTTYDNSGRVTSTIDALGHSTSYGYDALGRQTSVTDPLTNTITTAFDVEGHVIAQRGATYPVDYAYDEFGDKISMTTYRDINAAGDVTQWLRDEATGLVTNKVYADGKGPRYTYTPDGRLATRTWARGIVTTYSYDDNGALTNTVYSDGTPTISLAYNRAGRQVRAEDAAGVTTFLYDDFGTVTNETVIGVAGTNTIERFYDSFGRDAGYTLNGVRQSTLAYDPATGRLAMMQIPSEQSNNPNNQTIKQFTWNYLVGSDLKSSLAYPNGLTASWQYDANNQLLQVRNVTQTNTISQYDYMYDSAGRRITVSKSGTAFDHDDSIAYGYNARSELTNAVASIDSDYRYAYDFDDIGNRESSSERGTNSVYTSNNLNQYTAVDDFTPQFDDDGNQTLVKTATGVWQVTYNGENRPIHWSNGSTNIVMSFDRMGRRVAKNDLRFVYDGYLQIANLEVASTNSQLTTHNAQLFIWDPTEPVATRPLVWNRDTSSAYYTHDGNKNVSEVVVGECDVSAHYVYTPFGVVSSQYGASAASNPWRFSSEIAEDDTATVYYNYRHYEPVMGRWLSRDPIEDIAGQHSYIFESNRLIDMIDPLGLWALSLNYSWGPTSKSFLLGPWWEGDISLSGNVMLSGGGTDGVWKGSIKGVSRAEIGFLFGKSFAFGFGWRKSWNVMGRAGLRFFAGVDGGVEGSFEYNTCSGRGFANMVFPAKIYGGVEGIAKLTVYKYYKWANQHGSGYKMPNVYEIGMFVRGVISGDLRGTIKCDEKVCVISTTMVSEGTLSGGAKFFGWSVSLSRTEKFGEIKIFEDVVESPLRKLSRILR